MAHPLVVHCKRAPYHVYVGRGRCPITGQQGRWGNPFSHLTGTLAEFQVRTRADALLAYEAWLVAQPELLDQLPTLRGLVLGCWCAPLPCHGDVLARLANA